MSIYIYIYFTAKPWINKDGKPIKVGKCRVLNNMDSFRRYMFIRYLLLLKGLELANSAFCQYFQETYLELNRKIQIVMRLVDIYRPYLFFSGAFDDMNTEKLRMAAREGGVSETAKEVANFPITSTTLPYSSLLLAHKEPIPWQAKWKQGNRKKPREMTRRKSKCDLNGGDDDGDGGFEDGNGYRGFDDSDRGFGDDDDGLQTEQSRD
ncbi:fatty acyl-CoA reductase 3-like [Senna tora]|uniref:Fatty acyl-CoA reductase 3-like n=1 Tax=Senna tora TaxID=362788 RepID=A0A834WFG6_9FABA|nr:fatty acyl-CoA reductase 3-like [Senna tora]